MINTLLEKGLIPDPVIRWGIRNLLASRLREESRKKNALPQFVDRMKASPIAVKTAEANLQHYELPAAFFKLVLGKHMKYSSGYWFGSTKSLDQAEEAMLKITTARAEIASGQNILDLGCGWGSLSLWIAESFPKSKIIGVSNSYSQKEYIDAQIRARGLKNLAILTADMNSFDTTETFDRVVSIEMFEHMRNWERLLEKIALWLEPHGKLFIHVFTHREYAYAFEDHGPSDWMARNFFSGGLMPSDRLAYEFQKDLKVLHHWFVPGTHYAQTAEAWLKNLDARREEALSILAKTYGSNQAENWLMCWRMFFMACVELWGYQMGTEWQVSHYLFHRP